jgi:uncharacterized protein YacL
VSLLLSRLVLVTLLAFAGYFIQPFQVPNRLLGMFLGAVLGCLIIFLESKIKSVGPKTLIGSVIGLVIGIILAIFISFLIGKLELARPTTTILQLFSFFFFIYNGLLLGSKKADWFEPANLMALFGEKGEKKSYKILDTSVIIDGRIADLTETGFIEGTIVVPQFVLRELQHIADSPDSLKRNRGRRGIEILQRMQKKPDLNVTITEIDFPDIPEVDMKLIELAKQLNAKIVTNDYNLNKIAQLQGVHVLNINELASSLRPVVLPGETMKVFILKEGKEYNQGVAYLDDGTMVVVDNARKLIGRNVDVVVTSVLQTTVGKMIFGKHEET